MKVRDTSRGRMYAVSSNTGCTVINGTMAVDIPAGGQSAILALDKKLIIDGDDNAKFVEVRWGTNAAVGSRPAPSWMGDVLDGIVSIVGADKFDVNYIPGENKLYLVFSPDITSMQIEEVKSLCARVLPSNVVTEMEWADGLPMTYTRLEYLESTGTQYISTNLFADSQTGGKITEAQTTEGSGVPLGGTHRTGGEWRWYVPHIETLGYLQWGWVENWTALSSVKLFEKQTSSLNWLNDKKAKGPNFEVPLDSNAVIYDVPIDLFAYPVDAHWGIAFWDQCKIYHAAISQDLEVIRNFIPCLDDTGTPCMFDTVTRKPFYNKGTEDLLYPGKEEEATTYSLRNRMYAQYTENGIRRLYHVPEGYNGTKDEYAAEHGFKLLAETPMPEEGYWTPVWHDREDCIELEWVETEEPPTEELQIEEI